jgi:hypothetical protein
MVAGKRINNRHRNGRRNSPRHRRRCRPCRSHRHGWTLARSCASRATISSDIRRKSPMVRVLQQRERRRTAVPSGSRPASRSWTVTVLHAPKSLRRTSPNRPAGPTPTCHRPRHPPSPKAPAQGNDGGCRRSNRARHHRQALCARPRAVRLRRTFLDMSQDRRRGSGEGQDRRAHSAASSRDGAPTTGRNRRRTLLILDYSLTWVEIR